MRGEAASAIRNQLRCLLQTIPRDLRFVCRALERELGVERFEDELEGPESLVLIRLAIDRMLLDHTKRLSIADESRSCLEELTPVDPATQELTIIEIVV